MNPERTKSTRLAPQARTPDLFEPLGTAQQGAFLRAYLEHLQRLNGEVDGQRRFPRREARLREMTEKPVGPAAGSLVEQQTLDGDGSGRDGATLDPAALWALTTAKANLSERYAIELQLARTSAGPFDRDDPQSYIDLEEHYHTETLAHALAVIGVKASFDRPPLATRLLIAFMIRLPRALANVVILAAELNGVVLFRLLLDRARVLFAHQPRALARVELLFGQILADEIGHVLYVRSRLGRVRLWLSRRLILPIVARLARHVMPEIDLLFGAGALLEGIERTGLDELRRIHPDAVAADPMFVAMGLEPLAGASASGRN